MITRKPVLLRSNSSHYQNSKMTIIKKFYINKRLFRHLDSDYIFSPFPYSFRRGRNILKTLADVNFHIEGTLRSNYKLYTIFIDLPEACAFGNTA